MIAPTSRNADSGPGRSLTDAIRAALDVAEFGYHDLTDAEAKAVAAAVYCWCLDQGVDLLEFRG